MSQSTILLALDLCGAFLFALSGASRGVERRLDLFGVLIISYAAAVSGGIARDVLLGITPPGAIADWRFLVVTAAAGLAVFLMPGAFSKISGPVVVFDAIGLGFFAVNGALKALDAGLNPLMASVLGMITAVGGGIARDLLTARVPMILRADIYAVAALAGAAIAAFGIHYRAPFWPVVILAGMFCVALRLTAYFRKWHLPRARRPNNPLNTDRPDAAGSAE